jgi:hypothetical protein
MFDLLQITIFQNSTGFYFPAGALNLITFLNLKTQSLFHHVTFKTLKISLKMSLKAG